VRSGEVDDLVQNYGHVIVDEGGGRSKARQDKILVGFSV
jgi:hypothetical protein